MILGTVNGTLQSVRHSGGLLCLNVSYALNRCAEYADVSKTAVSLDCYVLAMEASSF